MLLHPVCKLKYVKYMKGKRKVVPVHAMKAYRGVEV
jgi:hypothetical protein